MRTGQLCNVRGYLDAGRITAICDEHITVEMDAGLMTVHIRLITRTWEPDSIGSDYVPRLIHIDDEEDEE